MTPDQEFGALVKTLAAELTRLDRGHRWTVIGPADHFDHPIDIEDEQHHTIRVRFDQRKQRIKFDTLFGDLYKYRRREEWPDITVSAARPPASIAADVCRRLLPGFRELRAVLLQRRREESDAAESVQELAADICAASRGYIHLNSHLNTEPTEQHLYLTAPACDGIALSGRVSSYREGSFWFQHGYFPAELLKRLAPVIADYIDEQAEHLRNLQTEREHEDTTTTQEQPATAAARPEPAAPRPDTRPGRPQQRPAHSAAYSTREQLTFDVIQSIFGRETV